MAWRTIFESDLIDVRVENDGTTVFEVNSGGIIPEYVTVRMDKREMEMLRSALNKEWEQRK